MLDEGLKSFLSLTCQLLFPWQEQNFDFACSALQNIAVYAKDLAFSVKGRKP